MISRTGKYYLCACNLLTGRAQGIEVRVPAGFDHEGYLEEQIDDLTSSLEVDDPNSQVIFMSAAESFVASNGMIITKSQRRVAKEFIEYARYRMKHFNMEVRVAS